jgi:tetratricopeptide (TPR) repeat protein
MLATLHHNLGAVAHRTDQLAEAEKHWNECRSVIQGLVRAYPLEAEFQEQLASNTLAMAVLCYDACRAAAARDYFQQAGEAYEKLMAQAPKVPAFSGSFAHCMHGLARAQKELGEAEKAKETLRQAEGLLERLSRDVPDAVELRLDLLRCRIDLANLLRDTGRPAEAEAAGRKALAEATEGQGKLPSTLPEVRFHVMILHNNLADYAWGDGAARGREAEQGFRTAVAMGEKLVADVPRTPKYRLTLSGIYNNLGNLVEQSCDFDAAEAAYRAALAHYDRLIADPQPGTHPQVNRAWAYARLASLRAHQGQPDAAREYYQTAVESARKALQLWPDAFATQVEAAWFFAACPDPSSRDLPLAAELALKATKRQPNHGEAWRALGLARLRQGDGPAAVEALLNARKYLHDHDRPTDFLLALAYARTGDTVLARQEYDRACQHMAAGHEHGEHLDRFRAEADDYFRAR